MPIGWGGIPVPPPQIVHPRLSVASQSAVGAIFSVADRVTVATDVSELAGIGMVSESATSTYGTAFLAGRCHALSPRHVVYHADPVGQRMILRFAPWRRSDAGNSSGATVIAAGGAASSPGDVSRDWILLRLDRCLGATLGFVPLSREPLRMPASGRLRR